MKIACIVQNIPDRGMTNPILRIASAIDNIKISLKVNPRRSLNQRNAKIINIDPPKLIAATIIRVYKSVSISSELNPIFCNYSKMEIEPEIASEPQNVPEVVVVPRPEPEAVLKGAHQAGIKDIRYVVSKSA
jgi:hypothetical protein